MKRNGTCPLCYLKRMVSPQIEKDNTPVLYNIEPYDNGMALTPPMGWSTWNTFDRNINEEVILGMAKVFREKGLIDAGYIYLNIDDCWEAKERNPRGELVTDYRTFPSGMAELVRRVNEQGMKLGIYSSNGSLTCQDFPASQGHEYIDAYTFAKWGVEYWKLDYCHNEEYTRYAPLVAGVSVAKVGEAPDRVIPCKEGRISGDAHFFKSNFSRKRSQDKNQTMEYHVSGLDAARGAIEFDLEVATAGEYVLTVYTHEVYPRAKYFVAQINNGKVYPIHVPEKIRWNEYYTQKLVQLNAGVNVVKLFNPICNNATSDMLQYQYTGKCVKDATRQYALDSNQPEKKIVFSLCEWGAGKPHLWGASAGNLWRTTGDIEAKWRSVVDLYERNVVLHEYAGIGGWNDPDMLEVGVGELTYTENVAHFALWCMMAAPLILGNDVRKMSDELLEVVKNPRLISIDQDKLGKQAKRVRKGDIDVLVKPLVGGTAVCVFNKGSADAAYTLSDAELKDEYISYKPSKQVIDAVTGESIPLEQAISGNVKSHGVRVFII